MFYYVFLVLILLMPLRNVVLKVPQLFGVEGLNLTNILYGIIFIGIIFAKQTDRPQAYRSKLATPLLLFVVYFFIQIFLQPGFHSYEHLLTWWKDAFLFMLVPYFFVTRTAIENKKIMIVLAVMCLANIYMDSYFWRWVRWMSFDSFADKMKSVNGTFGDVGGCNEWAAFFSTYTLIIIATAKQFSNNLLSYGLKLLAACNVMVLLFTFSRGGYLGFVVGLIYLAIRAKKYLLIVTLLSVPLFYTAIFPDAVVERIQMSFESTDDGETAERDVQSRLVMWEHSLLMIADAPVFGHGLLSFRYDHWRNPHNQHLNILVQGGIVGYGLFLWIFIASFRDASFLFRYGRNKFSCAVGLGMTAATLSLFAVNMFGDRWSYYVLTGYYWALCGIVCVLINKSLSSKKKENVVQSVRLTPNLGPPS